MEQRREYFSFFLKAAEHPGGMSYAGFLDQIRDDALVNCSQAERVKLESLVSQSLSAPPFQAVPPVGPGRKWTKEEALEILSVDLSSRDSDRGRNLFHAVSCAKCHRFNGEGGAIGPDLSTAARKYSLSDLLDTILDPSKAISDQYESHLVQTVGGRSVIGRVVQFGEELHIFTEDPDAQPVVINRADVEELVVSKVSQMPIGLVDTLNQEELRDLMAYITSAGEE